MAAFLRFDTNSRSSAASRAMEDWRALTRPLPPVSPERTKPITKTPRSSASRAGICPDSRRCRYGAVRDGARGGLLAWRYKRVRIDAIVPQLAICQSIGKELVTTDTQNMPNTNMMSQKL